MSYQKLLVDEPASGIPLAPDVHSPYLGNGLNNLVRVVRAYIYKYLGFEWCMKVHLRISAVSVRL